MDGPAPAILNAIAHATGKQFDTVPLLPEDIFRKMVVRELEREAVAQ
jgi:CO/xanthine dehydrogenase Mo-binding subunit